MENDERVTARLGINNCEFKQAFVDIDGSAPAMSGSVGKTLVLMLQGTPGPLGSV